MKLNQAIALLKGAKADGQGALTKAYHLIQKSPLMSGVSKTYEPRSDDGETLPSEGTKLQLRVPVVMADVVDPFTRLLDLTATVDLGNQMASADVVVDGVAVLQGVPVSTLLFLEKQLNDFATFVTKLPVLDAAETWEDAGDGLSFKTVPSMKTRTKKIPRNHVKAEATEKHPAQVEVYFEDVVVGDWTTVNFSGAISQKRQRDLATRVSKLAQAVKLAREEANSTAVDNYKIGEAVFGYLGWSE